MVVVFEGGEKFLHECHGCQEVNNLFLEQPGIVHVHYINKHPSIWRGSGVGGLGRLGKGMDIKLYVRYKL